MNWIDIKDLTRLPAPTFEESAEVEDSCVDEEARLYCSGLYLLEMESETPYYFKITTAKFRAYFYREKGNEAWAIEGPYFEDVEGDAIPWERILKYMPIEP